MRVSTIYTHCIDVEMLLELNESPFLPFSIRLNYVHQETVHLLF